MAEQVLIGGDGSLNGGTTTNIKEVNKNLFYNSRKLNFPGIVGTLFFS